jgi:hypothetical protein
VEIGIFRDSGIYYGFLEVLEGGDFEGFGGFLNVLMEFRIFLDLGL